MKPQLLAVIITLSTIAVPAQAE
ncbi:MAG: hypothetical protein RLZZ381_3788, partial [Cyanobacteriota bacterium]